MDEDDPEVIEERRRAALEVARKRSEAMTAGYSHLFGNGERRADLTSPPMATLYSFGGRAYQRHSDDLFSHDGRYLGRIKDDVIYDSSGAYIGEIRGGRIGFRRDHASRRTSATPRKADRGGFGAADRAGQALPAGWEDFTA